ncbi:uncharacterized protein si:ch211-67e16.4 isoform X3 [Triplophysa rosa]|uniref:uncharacterized protein si:ch211-67e16.4 isoform X3 n=1 Tax=Triplophysa rosa TaxID=992332 RepID=UPI002546093C|nr:uncharacterized protein si:ch211-67e16.4 isoform X3 [Triplophysa rosa]
MDVNLTISLMRGQMGAVIEKAVNVAVETVLGEMIRVVGLKFEEIKREMTVKEKENENIRKMLETSRSQMKTMRKYITLLSSKDQNRVYQGDGAVTPPGVMCRKGPTSTLSACTKPPIPCTRPRIIEPAPVSGPAWVRQQTHMPKAPNVVHEPIRSENFYTEEIHGSSGHKGNSSGQLVDSQELLSETSDPIWGPNPLTSAEAEHTDMADTGVLSTPIMTEEPSQTATSMTFGAPSLKIKQEEAEVEIVCVKDEHSEAANLPKFEFSNHDLHHQMGEPELGVPLDLPGSFQGLQCPSTTGEFTIPSFIGVDPSTYTVKEKTTAEKHREYRARRDADPVRREKYLRSERERWRRNIEAGKKKRIIDLCEKAQRWRRKKWREAKERQRTKNHFGPS